MKLQEKERFKRLVERCKTFFLESKDQLRILIVANRINCPDDYIINEAMDQIMYLCIKYGVEYKYFLSELDFSRYILEGSITSNDKKTLIYNRSLGGPISSRRILVPAVCSFNYLDFIGNDAYRMGLLCNKAHYYGLMKTIGIPVSDYWVYDKNYGWLGSRPPLGLKIIVKLANENATIGITKESVFHYTNTQDHSIHHLAKTYDQQVVVQKFITGYEITVPVFVDRNKEIYVPAVVGCRSKDGLRYGNQIISIDTIDDHVNTEAKSKYFDFEEINKNVIFDIQNHSKKIVECLGITSFSRFDLRIDDSLGYYFNDIASIPGILPQSSYAFVFENNGFSYEDFLMTTLCLDIM